MDQLYVSKYCGHSSVAENPEDIQTVIELLLRYTVRFKF